MSIWLFRVRGWMNTFNVETGCSPTNLMTEINDKFITWTNFEKQRSTLWSKYSYQRWGRPSPSSHIIAEIWSWALERTLFCVQPKKFIGTNFINSSGLHVKTWVPRVPIQSSAIPFGSRSVAFLWQIYRVFLWNSQFFDCVKTINSPVFRFIQSGTSHNGNINKLNI